MYGIPYTTVLEEIRDDDPFWNFGFTLALEPNLVAAPFEPGAIERALRLYGEVELASAEACSIVPHKTTWRRYDHRLRPRSGAVPLRDRGRERHGSRRGTVAGDRQRNAGERLRRKGVAQWTTLLLDRDQTSTEKVFAERHGQKRLRLRFACSNCSGETKTTTEDTVLTKGQELEAQHQVGLVQPLEGSPVPESWEDVYKAFDGQITDLPSDWDLVDKATLVGKPFIIYSFTLRDGDLGAAPTSRTKSVPRSCSPGAPVTGSCSTTALRASPLS